MATKPIKSSHDDSSTSKTKYYFAYGSNLHLKQMKRRCPNSRFIGCARLNNYRWQINERGYANVIEAQGHWVDGLVYEIDQKDEARLDINEGVAKNAYAKRHLAILLRCVKSPLYRRPVSWIVERGGPAEVINSTKQGKQKASQRLESLEKNALVYISLNYIVDSKPKDEYVNRINLGLADARILGIEEDYISNCIRPFVPASQKAQHRATIPRPAPKPGSGPSQGKNKQLPPRTTRNLSTNTGQNGPPASKSQEPTHPKAHFQNVARERGNEGSPISNIQANVQYEHSRPAQSQPAPALAIPTVSTISPNRQFLQRVAMPNTLRQRVLHGRKAASDVGIPPPLPPRPLRRLQSIPVIIVEESRHVTRLP